MLREAIRFLGPLRPMAKRSTRFFFPRYSWFFDRLNWEARLNATMKEFTSAMELGSREELYRYVNDTLLGNSNQSIDYLEFGVFEGASIRQWCDLNQNASSRFVGFDSFEGLPEDWHSGKRKGAFNTNGKRPEIADTRVSFVAGWFQQIDAPLYGVVRPTRAGW